MDSKEVQELLAQFDESSIKEFDLRKGEFRLYMNKHNQVTKNNEDILGSVEQERVIEKEIKTITIDKDKKDRKPSDVSVANREEVLSPIVGVVYLQPAPDKDVFKQQGDVVRKGEVICIIEAMKLMNEIIAPIDGVIEEVLVKNEEVVEFNQPLFSINKGAKV